MKAGFHSMLEACSSVHYQIIVTDDDGLIAEISISRTSKKVYVRQNVGIFEFASRVNIGIELGRTAGKVVLFSGL